MSLKRKIRRAIEKTHSWSIDVCKVCGASIHDPNLKICKDHVRDNLVKDIIL